MVVQSVFASDLQGSRDVAFLSIFKNDAVGAMQALSLYQTRCIHSGFERTHDDGSLDQENVPRRDRGRHV